MRKYLRVLAGVAALCTMSWAQSPAPAPAQTPAQGQTPDQSPPPAPTPEATPIPTAPIPSVAAPLEYPRVEFFAGGTYAETGFFNAGHWAGLGGWDAALAGNATPWLGFGGEGGQYFGTSQIPTASPAPFPTCGAVNGFCPSTYPTFSVATREYNFLFGLQFVRRKYQRFTPFGEILYGHQGARGQATAQGETVTEVGTGRAFIVGGGFDHKLNHRYSLRLKLDYLETGTAFPQQPKLAQDNFRVSVGIVIHNVHKKKRTLEDESDIQP